MVTRTILDLAPFDSVDASSWNLGPAWGIWCGFSGRYQPLRIRGSKDVWVEIEEYLRRARDAASRWSRELALLDTISAKSVECRS